MTKHRLFYITPIQKKKIECVVNWLGLTEEESQLLQRLEETSSLTSYEEEKLERLRIKRHSFGVTFIEGKDYRGHSDVLDINDKESYELVEVSENA